MLRPLPDQKSLVYFASGLRLNGVDNQAQLRATTNAALRANVSIFPVDARGLVANAPLGDATQRSPGGMAMFNGQSAGQQFAALQRSQDTLYSLAVIVVVLATSVVMSLLRPRKPTTLPHPGPVLLAGK